MQNGECRVESESRSGLEDSFCAEAFGPQVRGYDRAEAPGKEIEN